MNTPAISETPRPRSDPSTALAAGTPLRRMRAFSGGGAAVRPAQAAAARPPRRGRSPAWEILAGALLLVVWALLWSFFLTGVVEPGAALQRRADSPALRAWTGP